MNHSAPKLIFCSGGIQYRAELAQSCGWYCGERLHQDPKVTVPLYFTDQDWKKPNLDKYAALVEKYKPRLASVIDWENHISYDTVLTWAERIAPHVQAICIIPKVPGTVDYVPTMLFSKPVVLGFSIPSKYGGTFVDPSEFYGRDVHLLGGSPKRQLDFIRAHCGNINIVSLDNNYIQMKANRFVEYWSEQQRWNVLEKEYSTVYSDRRYEALRRSFVNLKQHVESIYHVC